MFNHSLLYANKINIIKSLKPLTASRLGTYVAHSLQSATPKS